MKKSCIRLGQKLHWDGRKDNVKVTVVDITLQGDNVGIMDGGITHVVDAKNLAEIPYHNENTTLQQEIVDTRPSLKITYDGNVHSLFILIDNKTTICVPKVRPEIAKAIGISYKNNEDSYNKEIGNSLAYYRSIANESKSNAEEDYFANILNMIR